MRYRIRYRSTLVALAIALLSACATNEDSAGDGNGNGIDVGFDARTDAGPSFVCVPVLFEGQSCPENEDAACLDELRCLEGTCQPESSVGGPCTSSSDCADDLFCSRYDDDDNELPSWSCQPEIGLDQPCSVRDFRPCASPFACIRGMCRSESGEGDPCEESGNCREPDSYCDETDVASDGQPGVCRYDLEEDDPCVEDNDGCGSGLDCMDGVCRTRGTTGQPCENSADCAVDFYCDRYGDDGTLREQRICQPEIALGEPCEVDELSNCDSGGDCVRGTCVDDQPEGGVCDSSGDCADGLYCNAP